MVNQERCGEERSLKMKLRHINNAVSIHYTSKNHVRYNEAGMLKQAIEPILNWDPKIILTTTRDLINLGPNLGFDPKPRLGAQILALTQP